jgi:hypothetical protein
MDAANNNRNFRTLTFPTRSPHAGLRIGQINPICQDGDLSNDYAPTL